MRLRIRNNEAWILRNKGSTSYTIYDNLEAVEEELFNMNQKPKDIELIRFSLNHGKWSLEQNDKFWARILDIMTKKGR